MVEPRADWTEAAGRFRDVWASVKKKHAAGQKAGPRPSNGTYIRDGNRGGRAELAIDNGGSADDIAPGVKFFADLKKAGNFLPVDPTPATVESGQTPVVTREASIA